MWQYIGQERPPFADKPVTGQESVWDYPRPPILQKTNRAVLVVGNGIELARSNNVLRLLETASPPGYYMPKEDVNWDHLSSAEGLSICEWKGSAKYWKLSFIPGDLIVGWSYPDPTPRYSLIKDYVSFYPGRVECYVNSERVRPQPGQFYGGWITDEISGPVKGEPGTLHW